MLNQLPTAEFGVSKWLITECCRVSNHDAPVPSSQAGKAAAEAGHRGGSELEPGVCPFKGGTREQGVV